MEGKKYYTCDYCYKEFEPSRRRVQKYCCASCRSKAYHSRKTNNEELTETSKKIDGIKVPDFAPFPAKTKVETMSLAGMGNAAAGSLAADAVKTIFTPMDSKPATKGDIKNLTYKLVKRYHRVVNVDPQSNGALPYFDMETNELIYSIIPLK